MSGALFPVVAPELSRSTVRFQVESSLFLGVQSQTSGKWQLTVQFQDDHRESVSYDSEEQAATYGCAVMKDYRDATFSITFIDSSVNERPFFTLG
jgi:hypothetical protein